jgi:RNA polymerase sigma-70 factor (ECF subfamily)
MKVNDHAPVPIQVADLVSLSEERQVIARLKSGDRTAFATLYGWYGDRIYRQAILPRLPHRELAEDCLRDTFRAALEKIDTYRLTNRSIFFWLRRIAINKAMDVHRGNKRDLAIAEAVRNRTDALHSHPPRPDRGLEVDDARDAVHRALAQINPRYAQVLRMRLLEDRTREECALVLDVTVGNFDVILHRATKAFRKVYRP